MRYKSLKNKLWLLRNNCKRSSFAILLLASIVLCCIVNQGCNDSGLLKVEEGGTLSTSIPTVSFVTFGDWGSGLKYQQDVAVALDSFCKEHQCEFVLTLGDNFYPIGVSSIDDTQWQTKYKDIYGSLGLPFYSCIGNHDADGSIQAQIDYASIDSSWHMPSDQYTFVWPEGSQEPLVEFFVIGVDLFNSDDKDWLEETIKNSKAAWKILIRHYPIITNKTDKNDDSFMEEAICNKVDLVLSGHNHLFSFLRGFKEECWLEQIIVGTGGAELYGQYADRDGGRLVTTASVHGFGWFQISQEKVFFQMITSDGSLVYAITWQKRT